MRQFTCPKAVTHPSTNRARCRATALIETNALPLHQTANQPVCWLLHSGLKTNTLVTAASGSAASDVTLVTFDKQLTRNL